MPQPDQITALAGADPEAFSPETRVVFDKCIEKFGFVPHVLLAYAARPKKLPVFMALYNELMQGESPLTKLEREMIAVVVSSANRCYYCLVAHGQAVRQLSGDPQLGEMLVMNYRVAPLSQRHRAMLDFVWKVTTAPHEMDEADRSALRLAGFTDDAIFDIADVAGFYNMSNRMASAIEMIPNEAYHGMNR
jgi:uncharacterized peroxidase-related enzyme